MSRRSNSAARQALVLAFAAGALAGAASTLTLRRRRQEPGLLTGDLGGHLGEPAFPPLDRGFDGPSQGSMSMPAAQHG